MPKCDSFTKYIPATFAWVLLLGTTSLFFYFPCRDYLPDYPWIPAYQGVITLFVIANFTLATFMDPGVIPRASPEEDREDDFRAPLYKNVEINGITVRMKWCVTCQFYRPPRCSHCSVCNVCIETFDHHCPWVNNCIGRRNYRFFFMFLISLSLHMTSIFTLCLVYVLRHKDELTKVETIVAMVLMGIILLLVIPIYGLTGFHMVLVSRGRTTNEQVTGKFKGGYNPFSRGCSRNCCYILCGPQYPSLLNASKYVGKPKRYPLSASAISTITSENQSNSPESSRRAPQTNSASPTPDKHTSTEANYERGRRAQALRERGTSTYRTSYPNHPGTPRALENAERGAAKPRMQSIQVQTTSEEVSDGRLAPGGGVGAPAADGAPHPHPHPHPHPQPHGRTHPLRPQREAAASSRLLSGGGGGGHAHPPRITVTQPSQPRPHPSPTSPTSPASPAAAATTAAAPAGRSSEGTMDKWVVDYLSQDHNVQIREARASDVQKRVETSKVIQFPLSEEIHHKFAWLPDKEYTHEKVMQSDHG